MRTTNDHPFLLLLLLLLPLSFCPASNVRIGSYDHLELVYTWPNTFCSNKKVVCKTPVPQNFTMHGLWPADRAGKTLVYCHRSGSISWALSNHEEQLATSWTPLQRDFANREFWQHQWDKHGSCALSKMTALQYLQVIITQSRRFDLLRALKKNNISPSGSSYSRKMVEAAVKEMTGGRNFYISCQKSRNGALMIKEIYICLDGGGGNTVISCPYSNSQRGCGGGKNMNLVFTAASSKHV